ncbi:MAG: hypothetical protein L6Q54_09020 [Leptospiraceae bacterium]|nr:hypothetical protein [Leptospiraceae bacterium]MCK6381375.1 hypothetical protein [Leptospiraceae bacterium]NUM41169.1 hypothetical protein [Leptospiraceae bacterium]
MEKIRLTVVIVLLSILAILTFTLSKSWFFFDKGIELKDEEIATEETSIEWKDDPGSFSQIIWQNFLIYPTGLVKESGGFGPEETLHHAKNLTFINLNTGENTKLFQKKVYIWDYFSGNFKKKNNKINSDEAKFDSIDIGNRLIIIAMTEDTNKDGFLNNRDKPKLYVYDPLGGDLTSVIPDNFWFERILYNTKKNTLALVIKKSPQKKEEKEISAFLFYNVITQKKQIIIPE